MLEAIKDALFGLIDSIGSVIEFVIDWIGHAITFNISMIQSFASYPKWLGFIPQPIMLMVIPIVTMAIGLRIVNRS